MNGRRQPRVGGRGRSPNVPLKCAPPHAVPLPSPRLANSKEGGPCTGFGAEAAGGGLAGGGAAARSSSGGGSGGTRGAALAALAAAAAAAAAALL